MPPGRTSPEADDTEAATTASVGATLCEMLTADERMRMEALLWKSLVERLLCDASRSRSS